MNTFRSTQDQGSMKCLPFYEQSKRERLNQKMGGIKFDPANDSCFFLAVFVRKELTCPTPVTFKHLEAFEATEEAMRFSWRIS